MKVFRQALDIARMEASLFRRFPKLKVSVIGILVIPALYALIYLSSVWDPAGRTKSLPAIIVNHDAGINYGGQQVNLGRELTDTLHNKQAFGFRTETDEAAARKAVRQGHSAFALIIPADFSATAVPGLKSGGGKLVVYASEGDNYTGAGLARRFAGELGHQVNETLNEKRWAIVLGATANAGESVVKLRDGVGQLKTGAQAIEAGLVQAHSGSGKLAAGGEKLSAGVDQLTGGVKQLGAGIRTMDAKKPKPQDLQALKSSAAGVAAGHAELGKGLDELHAGAQKLTDGAGQLRDETSGIPLVGGRISAAAGQIADGGAQLTAGLQSVRSGEARLADGSQRVAGGVAALTDGVGELGNGISTMAAALPADAKLDELSAGSKALAGGTKELNGGLGKLRDGSQKLSAGLELLAGALPTQVQSLEGSPRGLASSVEPVMEIDAPVANNGAGFAPNFVPVALWLGAVMTAFIFHLRRLPEAAAGYSRQAQILGKLAIPTAIVLVQALVILLMLLFILNIRVIHLPGLALTLGLSSITFMLIIVVLTRAFGDAGKAVALILLILQLSSGGGILPIELSGAFFQSINPWLPFTWVVRAVRASMFGAYDNQWLQLSAIIACAAAIGMVAATFIGRWRFVGEEDHRPAIDL
ncbi:MAG: YhgE/Pip domain-containing protein [Pseudomonadota bacterium]